MKRSYVVLAVLGSAATLIVLALAVIWLADNTAIHTVEDHGAMLSVKLLRDGAIVDVSIAPSKECIHLDIHYDALVTRHVDIPTQGKLVIIQPFHILPTTMHHDHFVDSRGKRWDWQDEAPLREPFPKETLRGFLGYDPEDTTCLFFWDEQGRPLRGVWALRK